MKKMIKQKDDENRVYKCFRGAISTTPSGVSNDVDAPPIDIQRTIFVPKTVEFFVPEKLFFPVESKELWAILPQHLIQHNIMQQKELTLTVKFADMNDGVVFVHTVEEFDGFKKVDNEKIAAKIDYFGIKADVLTAQLCELVDEISDLRAERSEGFTKGIFATLLKGAKMSILREFHEVGEPILNFDGTQAEKNGEALLYETECYSTSIVGLKMTDKATKKLQDQLDKISWV